MFASVASVCFSTDRVDECRDFYVHCLGAKVVFDCGWYMDLKLGAEAARVQFTSGPGAGNIPRCNPSGLVLNLRVKDVDAEHGRLVALGLAVSEPEDHPWGDRSFSLRDPNGIRLCIYMDIEPAEEYKNFYLK